jgi:PhzF family phenazine biosynthesis protein
MKTLPYQLIAVFTDDKQDARGNISAVVQLDEPLNEAQMQHIASDLNQPATTFLQRDDALNAWKLRWFAPDAEIGLCGHGTAAAAAFLAEAGHSGPLSFTAGAHRPSGQADGIHHTFKIALAPIGITGSLPIHEALKEGLGIDILEHYLTGNKNIVLVKNEAQLAAMKPKWHCLRQLDYFGYAVTAASDQFDFVSRTLLPFVQQLEDHATGSSHAALVPFWASRLNKTSFTAKQLSPRCGVIHAAYTEGAVNLSGAYQILAAGAYTLYGRVH